MQAQALTDTPHLCTCPGCTYTRECWRRGVEPREDALEPRDLLDCLHLAHLDDGHRIGAGPEENAWWEKHDACFAPWLRREVEAGRILEPFDAQLGAHVLVWVPANRDLFLRDRPQFSWDEITGHELLFDGIALTGLEEKASATHVLEGMRSFAAHLTAEGVIPPAVGAHLERELAIWGPRFVAYFDAQGPWYEPDGTPYPR